MMFISKESLFDSCQWIQITSAAQTKQLKRHTPMHCTQNPDHSPEMNSLTNTKTIKTNNINSDIHSAADKIDHDSIVTNDNPSSNT